MGAVLSVVAMVAGLTISSFCSAPAAGEPAVRSSVVAAVVSRAARGGGSAPVGAVVGVRDGPAASSPSPAVVENGGYSAPVPAPFRVVRAFDAPASPFAAGHRGVDLAATQGEEVTAAADGVVRFAGAVAGRPLVVLSHSDGLTTEYEPVRATVRVGQVVARGDPIGRVDGTHGTCGNACVHWGARRAEVYLDPLTLLRPLGPVRLLPCC